MNPIFSSNELRKIAEAIKKGKDSIEVSADLGLTKTNLRLDKNGFYFDNVLIGLPEIRSDDKNCYILAGSQLQKVQFFSPETNTLYKLVPTKFRPILQFSGTSMHKKKFIERVEKDRLKGKVLDAGTGLGYTAIAESKTAEEVITVEIDANVIEIAKLNPYSQDLFSKDNIKRITGDITEEIKKFGNDEFNFIVFDAGTPKSSGDFFSLNNYKEAFRVLKKNGKLYHYLPKPQVKQGRDFGAEVIQRMKSAGFYIAERQDEDSYSVAVKK